MPPVDHDRLPVSLIERFNGGGEGPAQDWGWARQRGIFRVCSLTEVDAWPGF
jgi:hypothetical protein